MKKRIGYFLLIVIAVFGSRLLYGINYDLNQKAQVQDNLYRYNIIGNRDFLAMYQEGNYLYYVTSDQLENGHGENLEYNFIKYDLVDDKVLQEYHFVHGEMLYPIKIVKKNNELILVSLYSKTYYRFNKDLELIKEYSGDSDFNSLYGFYNNNVFTISNNQVFYKDKLYDEIPISCGYNQDIIYSDNTYIRFYNYDKNLGCLYNLNNKSIYYLDYDNIDVVASRYLEYQNNSLKFRYNDELYYLNDITENYNIKMHKNGDYLLTYDSTNNYLRIYNLDTRRVIYEKKVNEFKNYTVENINIDDYAYFTVNDGSNMYVYIWDYLHENRLNRNMIIQNEKEYKFENDKLVEEIKSKYHVNVYLYDQAVIYINNYYVIPSYDEILIHTRLITLKNLLEEIQYNGNIDIYFEKEIYTANKKDSVKDLETNIKGNRSLIVSLVDNNFENNVVKIINK